MRLTGKLTLRLLRAQPGRTVMALLAIVLSAAMLTAIVGFLESAENAMRDQVIAWSGRQHISVRGLNILETALVKDHAAVAESWTDEDDPGTLKLRLTREFLSDPEAALKSTPLAALALAFSDAQVELNRPLIALEAPNAPSPLGEGFVRMTQFLMGVVVACAIVVIANGFSISLSERTRRIGLLRSAGATSRQMFGSVLLEALLLSLIGIPVGIGAGVLLQWGVLSLVMVILGDAFSDLSGLALRPALSWRLVVVPGLVALVTVLVSALRPAARAARVAPLSAIRETGEVTVRARDVRSPKWVQRLFGLEGTLALRTMRRNRRKYLTGILALTAASALFISVASFAAMAQRSAGSGLEGAPAYGMMLELGGPKDAAIAEMDELVATYTEGDGMRIQSLRIEALFDGNPWQIGLVPLPDADLRTWGNQEGFDADALLTADTSAFILLNRQLIPLFDGETLPAVPLALPLMAYENWDGTAPKDAEPFLTVQVAAATSAPYPNAGPYSNLQLVTGKTHYDAVFAALSDIISQDMARERVSTSYGFNTGRGKEFATAAQALIDRLVQEGSLTYGSVNNMAETQALSHRLILVVKLFVYGFIFMLTLIAVTSVVSTLSTGVALRLRQFALLRSAGMTPEGVKRTLRLESVLYAVYTCMLGIPLGLLIALGMHRMLGDGTPFVPAWGAVIAVIPAAFLVSWLTLMISSRKLFTLRIADTLRGL